MSAPHAPDVENPPRSKSLAQHGSWLVVRDAWHAVVNGEVPDRAYEFPITGIVRQIAADQAIHQALK